MPIRLEAPKYRPGGPDGKGWNRLSLCAHIGQPSDQCVLLPRSYSTLWESQHRPRCAQWGSYGRCVQKEEGTCGTCRVLTAKPCGMQAFTDKVLVRILERQVGTEAEQRAGDGRTRTELHLMNRPEQGWASSSYPATWAQLARLDGWTVGRAFHDEHSDGFWLHKANPGSLDGRPSPCPHEYLNPDHCRDCPRIAEWL